MIRRTHSARRTSPPPPPPVLSGTCAGVNESSDSDSCAGLSNEFGGTWCIGSRITMIRRLQRRTHIPASASDQRTPFFGRNTRPDSELWRKGKGVSPREVFSSLVELGRKVRPSNAVEKEARPSRSNGASLTRP